MNRLLCIIRLKLCVMSTPNKIKDIIEKSTQYLKSRPFVDNARFEAETLLAQVMSCDRLSLYLRYDQPLNEVETQKMREALTRRGTGEPMAYIVGSKGFYRHDFMVNPDVLIPRPETEHLIEMVLGLTPPSSTTQSSVSSLAAHALWILDLGCGSGCVGLTLAHEYPEATVDLVDLSPGALKVTELNAQALGVTDQVRLYQEDMAKFATGSGRKYHFVVSNPPYIDVEDKQIEPWVKKFEPALALFAPDQGRALLRSCIDAGALLLLPGGWLVLEHGDKQGVWVQEQLLKKGYQNIQVGYDLNKKWRVTGAQWPQ